MKERTVRDELIAVGVDQMLKAGYTSTGVKEILELAGVPKGSFYHYFPSKEAFGKCVLQSYLETEQKRATEALKQSKAAPLKRLRKYFEELIAIHGPFGPRNGGCLLGNFSQEVSNHSDLIQQGLVEAFGQWQTAVEEVLNEAVARGDLPVDTATRDFAALLLNSYEGALLRAKAERSEAPLRLFVQMFFNTFPSAMKLASSAKIR